LEGKRGKIERTLREHRGGITPDMERKNRTRPEKVGSYGKKGGGAIDGESSNSCSLFSIVGKRKKKEYVMRAFQKKRGKKFPVAGL